MFYPASNQAYTVSWFMDFTKCVMLNFTGLNTVYVILFLVALSKLLW